MTDKNVPDSDSDVLESTNTGLLALASINDESAWIILVQIYAPVIYKRCRRDWNMPEEDAENIGQEAFKAVSKNLAGFKRQREGSFRKWLNVIVDNKCRDHWRKVNVAPAKGGSGAHDIIASVPDNVGLQIDDDDSEVELTGKAKLMREVMQQVKDMVKAEKWQMFWDVIVEDRDRRDTARKYGVSDNTVYLAVSRTRALLEREFEKLFDQQVNPPETGGASDDVCPAD